MEISRVSLYSLKGIVSLSEFVSIGPRLKQILFSPGKKHNLGKRSETKKQIKPIRKQSKIWSLRYDYWPKFDMKIAKAIQNKWTMLKALENGTCEEQIVKEWWSGYKRVSDYAICYENCSNMSQRSEWTLRTFTRNFETSKGSAFLLRQGWTPQTVMIMKYWQFPMSWGPPTSGYPHFVALEIA